MYDFDKYSDCGCVAIEVEKIIFENGEYDKEESDCPYLKNIQPSDERRECVVEVIESVLVQEADEMYGDTNGVLKYLEDVKAKLENRRSEFSALDYYNRMINVEQAIKSAQSFVK